MADKFTRVSSLVTPDQLQDQDTGATSQKQNKQKPTRDTKEEDIEYQGPKFLGCMSIKSGFVIFGLSDISLVIVGTFLIRDGILKNPWVQIIFYLLFVPQVLMFFVILITDNILTRTIGYYLLLLKIVVQMLVFPILLLFLD